MTTSRDTPPGADGETIEQQDKTVEQPADVVAVQRVVTTEQPGVVAADVPPPHGPVDPDAPLVPSVVTESERVAVEPDGSVSRQAKRVEYAPAAGRRNWIVPTLLVILAIAAAAIAAAWYLGKSDSASVPSVVGLPLDTAVTRLEDDGFKADIVSQPNNEAAQGIVFHQSPSASTEQDKGSKVQLLVSKGPTDVTVPNAVGVTETEARDRLAAAGLKANVVEVFSSTEIGEVTAQDPAAGGSIAKGSAVRLNVSKGTAKVEVPSVVGTDQADAIAQVKAAGLSANVVSVPSQELVGTVVAQNPTGGQADRGSGVRLNVSSGPG